MLRRYHSLIRSPRIITEPWQKRMEALEHNVIINYDANL